MAGLHVYSKQPVQGFFYPRIRQIEAKDFLDDGYSFIEGAEIARFEPTTDQIYRFYKGIDGSLSKEAIKSLQSAYGYEYQQIKMLGGGKINKKIVRKVDTNDVLGELVSVQYSGGLVQDLLYSFFSADQVGRSAQCAGYSNGKNIIEEVIPPILNR
nr:hypothetical protein [Pseudomonas syringae]